MFVVVTITLAAAIHALIARRLLATLDRRAALGMIGLLSILFVSMTINPLSWAFDLSVIPYDAWKPLSSASFIAMGVYSFLFTAFLAREILLFAGRSAALLVAAPKSPDRRRLLARSMTLSVFGIGAAGAAAGYAEARRNARVVRVRVPIPDLAPELHGFRIVQISDLHVGPTIDRGYVEAIVEKANVLSADLVALTGDLVDDTVEHIRHDVEPLARLTSKHGIFVVTGNHEYYVGAGPWIDELRRLGMTVLLNAHSVVEHGGRRVLVAGVTDDQGRRFVPSHEPNIETCSDGAPACDVRLLLAHRPNMIERASKAGFHLQLSGHTHGGQFFPWTLAVRLAHRFHRGLGRLGATAIYVSAGTGYFGPPFRMFAPSEITLIELVRG
jgi:hypothetical protein